jgi:hypothetical protein
MRGPVWMPVAHLPRGRRHREQAHHTRRRPSCGTGWIIQPQLHNLRRATRSEGLRAPLIRLHEAGPGAWQHDREAAALMRYTARKYLPPARRHGPDVWDVASFAFDATRTPAARADADPWAVVTTAVKRTCSSEVRAAGLLVSTEKARGTWRIAGFHDAVRFADRENLTDWHPAFRVDPATEDDTDSGDDAGRVAAALSATVGPFVTAGWEPAFARDAVADVVFRLGDHSTRASAVEVLHPSNPTGRQPGPGVPAGALGSGLWVRAGPGVVSSSWAPGSVGWPPRGS